MLLRRTRSLLLRRGRQLSSADDASMFTAERAFPEGLAPQRIVSLVPSWTEALFALGLGDRVVGRTEWCTQPPGLDGAAAPPALPSIRAQALEPRADAQALEPRARAFAAWAPDASAKASGRSRA